MRRHQCTAPVHLAELKIQSITNLLTSESAVNLLWENPADNIDEQIGELL